MISSDSQFALFPFTPSGLIAVEAKFSALTRFRVVSVWLCSVLTCGSDRCPTVVYRWAVEVVSITPVVQTTSRPVLTLDLGKSVSKLSLTGYWETGMESSMKYKISSVGFVCPRSLCRAFFLILFLTFFLSFFLSFFFFFLSLPPFFFLLSFFFSFLRQLF